MNTIASTSSPLSRWMTITPEIDNLSIFELTLPGTHNAGCDWKASYALLPGKLHTACQYDTFHEQLKLGSRALDVRLEYYDSAKGLSQFRFQHNGYLSSRTLGNLLDDVNRFLDENPDEFIVLDFHKLQKGDSTFNFIKFRDVMIQHLGDRMIPTRNAHRTLGELKQMDSRQRVYVAAPMTWDSDTDRFHPSIAHSWIGKSVVSAADLHTFITEELSEPRNRLRFWSLSATAYSIAGPRQILSELDNWFSPVKSDWAKKCNIINFDFIKDSYIVHHCRFANIEKANVKSAAQPRALTE